MDAIQKRFGSDLYHNPQEVWKELKHNGSVVDYQQEFESLSTKITIYEKIGSLFFS